MKKRAFQGKYYGASSEILEWESKYLHKSERGNENSIKYMRMSSTPSPQVINDPSLRQLHSKEILLCQQLLFLSSYRSITGMNNARKHTVTVFHFSGNTLEGGIIL